MTLIHITFANHLRHSNSIEEPLAEGFDLRQGWVTVTVPDVTPGSDYEITRACTLFPISYSVNTN